MHSTFKMDNALYQIRSDIWLRDLIIDWASIVALFAAYAYFDSIYLVPIFALLIGSRQHALGLLAHDATHRLAFKNRAVNDFFGDLFIAWPFLLDIKEGYRPWHFAHHKYLGTPFDPELSYRGLGAYEGKVSWLKIVGYALYDMCGLGALELFAFMKAIFPYKKPLRFLGPILLWSAFLAITYATGTLWIAALWSWSLVTGFWTVFRLRTWTEHVGVDSDGSENTHRFFANPIARLLFCPHHTDHHYEHHRWAQVPYYHLPRLRAMPLSNREVLPMSNLFEVGLTSKKMESKILCK